MNMKFNNKRAISELFGVGFIKKVDKVPANEIERAINIRKKYFDSKTKK